MHKTYFDWLRSLSKEEMAEYMSKHFSCSNCLGHSKQNWLKKLSENMPIPKLEVGDIIFTARAGYVYLGGDTFVTNVIEDYGGVTLVHKNKLSGEILSVNRRLADETLTTIWEKW